MFNASSIRRSKRITMAQRKPVPNASDSVYHNQEYCEDSCNDQERPLINEELYVGFLSRISCIPIWCSDLWFRSRFYSCNDQNSQNTGSLSSRYSTSSYETAYGYDNILNPFKLRLTRRLQCISTPGTRAVEAIPVTISTGATSSDQYDRRDT